MNINTFILTENTTLKEAQEYAKVYCKQGDSLSHCEKCKVHTLCGNVVFDEWKLPKPMTYLEHFKQFYPDVNVNVLCACTFYPNIKCDDGNVKMECDDWNCGNCWNLPMGAKCKC